MAKTKATPKMNGKKKAQKSGGQMSTRPLGLDATTGGRTIVQRKTGPQISQVKDGLRVRNTERLASINVGTSGLETRSAYIFNPASNVNNPWLANLANNYSMYRIHKLEYSYVPFVGTQATGEVALGIVYDAEEAANWAPSGSLANLAQLAEFCSGPPYSGGSMSSREGNVISYHGVVADTTAAHRRSPWLLCDPSPTNQSERNLCSAVGLCLGYISNTIGTIGTMYVSYDVEFIKPTNPNIQ